VSVNTVFRKFTKWTYGHWRKACNNIPEAVNKLALSARLDHSYETGW